jgi:hypothetical protein
LRRGREQPDWYLSERQGKTLPRKGPDLNGVSLQRQRSTRNDRALRRGRDQPAGNKEDVPRKEPKEVSITQAKEEGPPSLSGRDEARKGRDGATEERIGHRARTLP